MLGCKVSKVDYGETMKLRGLNTDNCATSTDKHCIPHPGHGATQTKNTKNTTLDITGPLPVETYKSLKTK